MALSNQPVKNEGMFALMLGHDRLKPYRLVVYGTNKSDGFRMTMVDLNKLLAALQQGETM